MAKHSLQRTYELLVLVTLVVLSMSSASWPLATSIADTLQFVRNGSTSILEFVLESVLITVAAVGKTVVVALAMCLRISWSGCLLSSASFRYVNTEYASS